MIDKAKGREIMINYFCIGNGDKNFIMLPGMSIKSIIPSKEAIASAYGIFLDEYKIYAFDRREDNPDPYSIREMAEDTYQKIKEIGIDKAVVFGASQGGMIALCMAIDHPEFVTHLILASSLSRSNEMSRRVLGNWGVLAGQHKAREVDTVSKKEIYSKEILDANPALLEHAGEGMTNEELDRFAVMARSCDKFDVYDELTKIKCPVFVIGARNDRVLNVVGSLEIAEKLNCELYIYENHGHGVFDEAPDIKQRIYDFLKRNP